MKIRFNFENSTFIKFLCSESQADSLDRASGFAGS